MKSIKVFLLIPLFCFFFTHSKKNTVNISAEKFKKINEEKEFVGNVVVSVEDIKIKSNILKTKDDNDYRFIGDVYIFVKSKEVNVKCVECLYNQKEQTCLLDDVEIDYKGSTFYIKECVFYIKEGIIKYEKSGFLIFNDNTISSKCGEYNLKNNKMKLYKNLCVKNATFFLSCKVLNYDLNCNEVIFENDVKIKINKIKDLEINTANKVVYDIKANTVTLNTIRFSSKRIFGECDNAIFFVDNKELNLKNKIKIKSNEGDLFYCSELIYNIELNNGSCPNEAFLIFKDGTMVYFNTLSFIF